ncbi:hypothetical protein DFJ67_6249 [Asanoa ferruginea]|uniref:Uncharacterized protein n=1 Tax=Asanoa ferruginea TaxID=53367 RepID=A0A3D9ZSQ8_9ACTN|nr:hypothetical protein [Asanoa ferruginea]REG00198.1 hypothetical protein DFJ67_6249 [Asanoa ferruginea]GIF46103.1 hypothetical protein Afe04nite_06420 [Asanoa ferruginea]
MIRPALDRTIDQATFTFDYLATDDLVAGLSSTTRGYCDLSGPVVAAEIITDLHLDGLARVVRSRTFTHGTTLFQQASDDGDWVALDSHGVGSTALAALYWLYGVESATAGADGFAVTISFPRLLTSAPEAVRATLREGLRETRPDLLDADATGTVQLGGGLVLGLTLDLPPDPVLDHPPLQVRLALRPTPRRAVDFPIPSARMSAEAFLRLYGDLS